MEEHPSEISVDVQSMAEQLFEAATTGNAEFLRQISDPRIFAAQQHRQGDNACHVALQQGHLEFAREIASLHPRILYTPNAEGDTVLHRALKIGQPEFFAQSANRIREYLGENIKYTNKLPCILNPLMLEARRCYNSSWDSEQRSLLYLAAEKGYFEAVKILLRTPALNSTDSPRICRDRRWTFVSRERFKGFAMKAPVLHATGTSTALHGHRRSTALHAAVLNRHYGMVQLLVQRNGSLIFVEDEDGRTPMYIAVMLKCVEMCNLLLMATKYRDPFETRVIICGRNDASAFFLAAQNDDCLEIFRYFVRCCPGCCTIRDSHGANVLHAAVKAGALGIVKLIVEHKKLRRRMINERDNDGDTPLSLATASNGNEEMLKVMLLTCYGDKEEKPKKKPKENYHSSLLVMATLITTITFAAAFSLPGGYKSDDPNEGTAALIGSAAFRVFLVFDTLSFLFSSSSMAYLIAFARGTRYGDSFLLGTALRMIWWSLSFMLAAFAAGVWAVIHSECKWLAILIVVMTSCTLFRYNPFIAWDLIIQTETELP